ncbi:AAA family ATPase [Actinoplanes couchii]|uniref:ORC1/DEAH AAA+ ATPase domain-containing protein n=1 Tax=Actinoplanes couchii TaxID=403638 RepID=A0ABQ3XF67_9ACTN|nr:AAA family ATPase [Actinoplanes couchii]MDR6319923.1 hypothetical protein [Actinoplanes couchii]GID57060.1 hypothetical protein Aco03nite_054640 [Actinoplanes couchii]
MTDVHIDRRTELARIAGLLAADESGVGVVCGEPRIGKTALLAEAFQRHRPDRPAVLIDLEETAEPGQVLERIVTRLRGRVTFPSYERLRARIPPVRSALRTGDVTLSGSARMTFVVDGVRQRAAQARQLTPVFVEDLARAGQHRPLLLFDHFDRCPSAEVRGWLREDLLPGATLHADVLVLVASAGEPWGSGPPAAWLPGVVPYLFRLGPFTLDDVRDWLAALGIDRSDALADYLWRRMRGVPGPIRDELVPYLLARRDDGR